MKLFEGVWKWKEGVEERGYSRDGSKEEEGGRNTKHSRKIKQLINKLSYMSKESESTVSREVRNVTSWENTNTNLVSCHLILAKMSLGKNIEKRETLPIVYRI